MNLKEKYLLVLSFSLLIIAVSQQTFSDEDVDSGDGYDDYEEGDYDDGADDMSGYGDPSEDEEEEEDDTEDGDTFGNGEEYYSRPCSQAIQKIGSSNGDDDNRDDDTFIPQCTNIGEFEPRQCHKSWCWCVSRDGVELKGSRHPDTEFKQCGNFNPDIFKKAASTNSLSKNASFSSSHPAFLAAIVVMVVMGLAGAVLVAMFIVYRMRKKDEGSYALAHNSNSSAPERRSTRSLIFGTAAGGGTKEGGHAPDQHFYSLQQQLQQPLQQEFYA